MRFPIAIVLVFLSVCANGQEWQAVYDRAVGSYKAQQYEEAIQLAQKGLSLAADDRTRVYCIQIITASCVESNDFQQGLAYADQEIEIYSTLEPRSKNHLLAVQKKGSLLLGSGEPLKAALIFDQSARLAIEVSGETSYAYYSATGLQADALMSAKKYAEAIALYNVCLPGYKTIPDAGEDYLYGLFNIASAYHALNQLDDARKKFEEFVSSVEANALTDIPEYEHARKLLSSINSSGTVNASGFMTAHDKTRIALKAALDAQGSNKEEALRNFRACEELIRENTLVDAISFSCYLNYGRFLYSLDDFASAQMQLTEAKKQSNQLFSANSPEVGHVMILEADLRLQSGRKDDAVGLYELGLKNLRNAGEQGLAKQFRWVAEQLLSDNLDRAAIGVLSQILEDGAFTLFEVKDRIMLHRLNGTAHMSSRQFARLTQYLTEKLSSETDGDLRQNYLFIMGLAAREAGDWNDASRYFAEAAQVPSARIVLGEVFYEQARLFQQLGNLKEAELAYRKAIENVGASLSPVSLKAQMYNSFGTFYIDLGNFVAAEKLLSAVLAETTDAAWFYNSVRQNLAALYEQTGRFVEARKQLKATLESDRTLLGDKHPDYGIALQNLAALYKNTGQADSALVLYQQALDIDRANSGEGSLGYATKLANLGTVYQDMGNFAEARKMLEQSLSIRKKLLGADHPDYAHNLYDLAHLLYLTGEVKQALPYFQAASAGYLKLVKDVFPVLSDYERTAFYNKIHEVIQLYEAFLVENKSLQPGLAAQLLNFRLETKALLLNASVKARNQIMNSGNPELIRKFSMWQHTKEQIAYLYSLSIQEQEMNRKLIDENKLKSEELEKSLSIESDAFAASFVPPPVDWRAIQNVLKPHEAAIEVLRVSLPTTDSVVYAMLLIKKGLLEPEMMIFSEGRQLETRFFRRYINGIRFQDEDRDSYGNYWKEIESALKDVTVVYMSPDGIFNKINCSTLLDPVSDSYLIDRLQIGLVTNLRELLTTPSKPYQNDVAFLFGSPDYRLNASQVISEVAGRTRSANPFYQVLQGGVAELPGTAVEVKKINETLISGNWKVKLYTREEALEENLKAVKNPGILHIATHGFFIAQDVNKEGPEVFSTDLTQAQNNVMLRSGLLLAGAEKNLIDKLSGTGKVLSDDGVLTAYEVMNLTLDQTDLVVLSACETGSGDVRNGEGVYGLQRAFMVAGASNLMMSLWKVDDAATQEMMAGFYESLVIEKDKRSSFYHVQKKMKEKFGHPYYWGAFVMVGTK